MRFDKYHGLGNDYLVLCTGEPLDPGLVRALCDRHTGIGGDGVLEPFATEHGDLGIRIWNPDGSTAEKSGNGLRIAAHWAHTTGRLPADHTLWTGRCRVACEVRGDLVTVDMGVPSFAPGDVPLLGDKPWREHPLQTPVGVVKVTAVGLGNPHAVVLVEDLEDTDWRAIGLHLETHPSFPNRTNVQVVQESSEGPINVRIWERGAGETMASGSSACAVVAVMVSTGRRPGGIHGVSMVGGTMHVEYHPGGGLSLCGPVESIASVEPKPAWIRRHTATGFHSPTRV